MAHQHHNVCGSKKGATGQAWRGECVGPPCLESGVSTTTMSQSELLPDFLSVLCHPMMSSRSEAWGPNKWQKFYDREKTNSTSFTVQKLNEKNNCKKCMEIGNNFNLKKKKFKLKMGVPIFSTGTNGVL